MACLGSLAETAGKEIERGTVEVLVQDDASRFDVFEIGPPWVLAERNPHPLGFPANCNAGTRRASGEILLFLNQDATALPGWIEALRAAFQDPRVGIVGPKILFGKNDHGQPEWTVQSAGGFYDRDGRPQHRYLGYHGDDPRVNEELEVAWTTGAVLAIRRFLFDALGGFDAGYEKGYFEDVDLCERAKERGFQVLYHPKITFTHSVASTGGIPRETFTKNMQRFIQRWRTTCKHSTGDRLTFFGKPAHGN